VIVNDFDQANQKAWEIGVTYDWGGVTFPALRVPGLSTAMFYGEGFDAGGVSTNTTSPKRREADISIVWRPAQVRKLQFRTFGALGNDEHRSRLFHTVGMVLDFELPLF
jgi:hypothetical protein